MSLAELFRKKTAAALLTGTLACAGSYGGYRLAHEEPARPEQAPASLTLSQQSENTAADPLRERAVAGFTRRIEKMEQDIRAAQELSQEAGRARERAADVVIATDIDDVAERDEERQGLLEDGLVRQAADFVSDLRLSDEATHIAETDYRFLVADFMKRAGTFAPGEEAGNYRLGAAYWQECFMHIGARQAMGFSEESDEEISASVGDCMKEQHDAQLAEAQALRANDIKGAGGGAIVGGLLSLPFWRRRKPGLKV